ncbi:DNA-processing protein DprA [Ammoniphilus sp. CFH 90114]|uniref:DNA-processing protein DprA n=1 Tax=Ammoniphilus sp. CFH 90114 TaxID=2493665 RepID=UPI0013E985A1|nr:DNA-processing protein DprA [Ammoniphilus sp. CFH 90114]
MTIGLRDWLISISQLESIGRKSLAAILPHIEDIASHSTSSHLFPQIPELTSKRLKKVKQLTTEEVIETKNKLRELRVQTLTIIDPSYPALLREIADPPFVLYARGNLQLLDLPAMAVVGTRLPTPYGKQVAFRFSEELDRAGFSVLSGLAKGIDAEAHRGSLAANGHTIAVLGSGINVIYPPQNEELYKRILERGLILSEYPPGYPSHPLHFPARNRLISGLSQGVLVVEAAIKSGSVITVRCALDQGKEVLAVPGAIVSAQSQGTNRLIQEGAKLVTSISDILDEFPQYRIVEMSKELTDNQLHILDILENTKKTINELVERSHLSVQQILSELLSLQLQGKVEQLPGSCFVKKT